MPKKQEIGPTFKKRKTCLQWSNGIDLRPTEPNVLRQTFGQDRSHSRIPCPPTKPSLPSQTVFGPSSRPGGRLDKRLTYKDWMAEQGGDVVVTPILPKRRLTYGEWLAEQKVPDDPPPPPPSAMIAPQPPMAVAPPRRISYRDWLADQQKRGIIASLHIEKTSDAVVNSRLCRANQKKSFPEAEEKEEEKEEEEKEAEEAGESAPATEPQPSAAPEPTHEGTYAEPEVATVQNPLHQKRSPPIELTEVSESEEDEGELLPGEVSPLTNLFFVPLIILVVFVVSQLLPEQIPAQLVLKLNGSLLRLIYLSHQ